MSANNSTTRHTSSALSEATLIPRRIASNLYLWIAVLVRKPRAKAPPIGAGPLIRFVAVVAVIIASMFFLDAAASQWARQLPHWVAVTCDEISNFALGSRFSYPLGFFILLLAALMSPSLPLSTRGVLEVFAARAGFLFVGIGLRRSVLLHAIHLAPRLRQYAVGSFDHRRGGGSCDRRHLAAGAPHRVALRADHHVGPRLTERASSKRCDCRRTCRHRRRIDDPALVRCATPGVLPARFQAVSRAVLAPGQGGGPQRRRSVDFAG
jgi:hypothetical protein